MNTLTINANDTMTEKNFKNDLLNRKFGRLTPIKRISKNRRSYWICNCDCGNQTIVRRDGLLSGRIVSCGWYNKEKAKKGDSHRKHGKHGTRLYRIWQAMITRCYNQNQSEYKSYGGRGITVCDEWLHDFEAFYKWAIANGYDDSLTIDRIDNNGNYKPSNCRWATRKEQANNKSNNILLTYCGITKTVAEWSEIQKIPARVISWRIKHKWSVEKALETPKISNKITS